MCASGGWKAERGDVAGPQWPALNRHPPLRLQASFSSSSLGGVLSIILRADETPVRGSPDGCSWRAEKQ
ncbi:hypothetical protein SAMN05444581_109136 [Methylocapsa palsarum]|uniref:Uncharacterized protein n=1 Tax=Methylocapsa palsarum TaxID=1612308 RepID=A0A1I4A981_9HYPH|nr:hypothetical protein SAMN05444581_109136 [Methylocapsa palsarum]